MSKTERLFQLLNLLRNRRRAITAHALAEAMDVSERTVYRDIQSLVTMGVPVEGEAGIGYRLKPDFQLPPLMFTNEELVSLALGAKMVKAWGDHALGSSAMAALEKIQAALPTRLNQHLEEIPLIAPAFNQHPQFSPHSEKIREAIRERRTLQMEYAKEDGERSQRLVQPLGMVFWGKVWTLLSWCELRDAYRNFRVDRIIQLTSTAHFFEVGPEKSLQHYLNTWAHED